MLLNVSFLGFFLAGIILLFSSYRKSKNAYLAAYLLFSNLFSLTYWLIFQSKIIFFTAIFAIHITPFYFLTQPIFHLYIISHQTSFKLKAKNYLLFLPFLLALINILPYILLPFSYKIQWATIFLKNPEVLYEAKLLFLSYYHQSLLRPFFNFIFILYSTYIYFKIKKTLVMRNDKFNEQTLIFIFLIISGLLNLISFILICHKVLIQNFNINLASLYNLKSASLVISYFYAAQNLLLLFFPQVLFDRKIDASNSTKKVSSIKSTITLSNDLLEKIESQIQKYLQDSKPYLTQGFSLTTISQNTRIPAHQLSYYFNDHLKRSFNDWKNHLRIEYVVSEINDGKHENFTLESLASSSGFASRANFNKAFLMEMNQTPTEYIKGKSLKKK